MLELLAAFAGGLCLSVILGMVAMATWNASVGARHQRDLDRARRILRRLPLPGQRDNIK